MVLPPPCKNITQKDVVQIWHSDLHTPLAFDEIVFLNYFMAHNTDNMLFKKTKMLEIKSKM